MPLLWVVGFQCENIDFLIFFYIILKDQLTSIIKKTGFVIQIAPI